MVELFSGQTDNGNSAEHTFAGGVGILIAEGTWDSGTMIIQVSPDDGTTWIASGASLTDDGVSTFELPANVPIRANLAGAGSPNLNAWFGVTRRD